MPILTKIAPANPNQISVEFDTQEKYTIAYPDLRFACPCASCVDEITGKRTLKRESVREDVRPLKVEPVGRYAVAIRWSDGHSTGMYSFDRLYDLGKNPKQNLA